MQITPQNADHETTKQKQKSTYHATERNTTKTRILPQTKAQNTHTHTQMQIRPETSKQNETQVMPQEKHTKKITQVTTQQQNKNTTNSKKTTTLL